MRLGLGEGRPTDCRLTGFVPPADGPPGIAARLRMLGKKLGGAAPAASRMPSRLRCSSCRRLLSMLS